MVGPEFGAAAKQRALSLDSQVLLSHDPDAVSQLLLGQRQRSTLSQGDIEVENLPVKVLDRGKNSAVSDTIE